VAHSGKTTDGIRKKLGTQKWDLHPLLVASMGGSTAHAAGWRESFDYLELFLWHTLCGSGRSF